MAGDGLLRGSSATASVILAHRDLIGATWRSLLDYSDDIPGGDVIANLTNASVVAFAGYLRGDDFGRTALALLWNEVKPDAQLVAEATVAMSVFPEALRRSCELIPECSALAPDLLAQAVGYIRRVTNGILQSTYDEPSPNRWSVVSQHLELQRVRRAARLSVLTEIARVINTADRLDDLFEQVRMQCARAMDVDNFMITLFDREKRQIRPRLIYVNGDRRPDLERDYRHLGLTGVVAETCQPINVSDYCTWCHEHGVEPSPLFADPQQFAFMAAPMLQNGQVIGVVAAISPVGPFQQEDVDLLTAVAQQTAVAMEHRRLFSAERRRAEQLKAVNQLVNRIVTVRDPDLLLTTTVELIHELFGYSFVSIFLIDPEKNELVLQAHSALLDGGEAIKLRLPVGERGLVGDVAATGCPVVVGDVSADRRYFSTPQTESTRSEIVLPLRRDDQILGVLDVQSPELEAFDDLDLMTLTTISDQIVLALENAHLFNEEQDRSQALSLMLRTTREASSSLVLDEVLERLAMGIAEAAGSSKCTIYLLDEDQTTFQPAVSVSGHRSSLQHRQLCAHPLPIDASPTLQKILATQQPIVYESTRRRNREGLFGRMCGTLPSLLVPLTSRGQTLGLALVVANQAGAFTEDRIRLVQGVADSAALAIENARLYANSQGLAIAEERGRLAHEIHDGLAQGLTGISLQLDLADAYLPTKPEQAKEKVRRALELSRINLEEARRSVLDLRAARVQEMALPDALRRLVQVLAHDTGVDAEFASAGLSGRLSARLETGLYRIAEEALANIRKHANAHHVNVTLSAGSGMVELRIYDDGRGFDPEIANRVREPGVGFGLIGIRERARLLKGTLRLQSAPGMGTELTVSVPFEASVATRLESEQGG